MLDKEITEAIIDLNQAHQNFKYADPNFIDVAIMQEDVAEFKLNILFNLRKEKRSFAEDRNSRADALNKNINTILSQKVQTVKRKLNIVLVNSSDKANKKLIVKGKNF